MLASPGQVRTLGTTSAFKAADSACMTAVQNPKVRTFRVGQFMCAIAGASSEAAMALIQAPGGTAQRMQARLKAVEMLIRNGVLDAPGQEAESGAQMAA
jgi:hypothetical protein